MASLTPDRRPSTGSSTDVSAATRTPPPNFSQTRRFSRAYDRPVVQKTHKGIMVSVQEEPYDETPTESAGTGKVLDPTASKFGNLMAKFGLFVVTLLGVIASVVGRAPLAAIAQLLGFLVVFTAIFALCVGLFLWWGSWSHDSVQLSVKKVMILYGIFSFCDVLARAVMMYVAVPDLPFEATYYVLLGTLLFFLVSLLAHKDGLNSMFSQETSVCVGLTLLLDFSLVCMFGHLLPSLVLTQMVCASSFLGLTLSLLGQRFPLFSLSEMYWSLSNRRFRRQSSIVLGHIEKKPSAAPSLAGSSVINLPSRTSYSSISSMATSGAYHHGGRGEIDIIVNEAHGLIGDLLLKETLTDDASHKLKRVKELLTPKPHQHSYAPRMIVGNHIMQDERDYEGDVSSDISRVSSAVRRRSHGVLNRKSSMALRRTTTRFSTTTTSSGMPVLDTEPLDRNRSLALRDIRARISVQEKRSSVHKMTRDRIESHGSKPGTPTAESPLVRSQSPNLTINISGSSIHNLEGKTFVLPDVKGDVAMTTASMDGSGSSPPVTEDGSSTDRQPVADQPRGVKKLTTANSVDEQPLDQSTPLADGRSRSFTLPKSVKLSPFSGSGKELEEEQDSETDTPKFADQVTQPFRMPGQMTAVSVSALAAGEPEDAASEESGREGAVIRLTRGAPHGYSMFSPYKKPDYSYSLEEYSSSELDVFENVALWDFPIFELEKKAGDHILSHMTYLLFQEAGLMETFRIPQREFVNFFRALEANYGANVYHNKTHAADVLHGVSYLLFEMIPEFSHEFSQEVSSTSQRVWKGQQRMKTTGGNIASAFSILEVFACYMAAALHDFDHPGRTNAFLVATKSPLAVLYNDRSVLENHHVAASWDLLTSVPANSFLEDLEAAEMKRFRFLLIEAILATDLKLHFDILSEFKSKVNPEEGGGIDWESEVDRLLVMKMLIKMADINTPAKSYDLHRSWAKRITEEFYQQSEEEVALGLQGTIFMDRNHPEKLPAIQLSFIQNLVSPLFHAAAEARIIPGITEATSPSSPVQPTSSTPAPKAPDEQGEASGAEETRVRTESLSQGDFLEHDIEDEACMIGKPMEPVEKFMSIILTNLDINYEGWRAELPPDSEGEEEEKEEGEREEVNDLAFTEEDSQGKGEGLQPVEEAGAAFTIPEVKIDNENAP